MFHVKIVVYLAVMPLANISRSILSVANATMTYEYANEPGDTRLLSYFSLVTALAGCVYFCDVTFPWCNVYGSRDSFIVQYMFVVDIIILFQ
jgi:hypothetical protein